MIVVDALTVTMRALSLSSAVIPSQEIARVVLDPHAPHIVSSVNPLHCTQSTDIAPTESIVPLCAIIIAVFAFIGKSNRVLDDITRDITPESCVIDCGVIFGTSIAGMLSLLDESIEILIHFSIFRSYAIKYWAT